MKIFYLKKSEFLPAVDVKTLEFLDDGRNYQSLDKKLEHLCGLFLIKFIAKNIYNIENLEIEIRNHKPFFKDSNIFFSISHSEDIVLVAIDDCEIGADVEYIQDRNYLPIMKRYGCECENPSLKDFYRFWTKHEAKIKLGKDYISSFSTILEDKYMFTCLSGDVLVGEFSINKIFIKGNNINLIEEIEQPNFLQFD